MSHTRKNRSTPRQGAKRSSGLNKARREMLIKEHRAAIEGAKARRSLMGDAWADATIAYRKGKLSELGAKP